jgi:hypothetical protein
MKVIDLLNKIANGEEVPKKIKCDGVIYNYEFQNTITGAYEYRSQNYNCLMNNMAGHLYLTDILNNEVEIIEEDKEIEYLKGDYTLPVRPAKENEAFISGCLFAHEDKINELVKAVNELKNTK